MEKNIKKKKHVDKIKINIKTYNKESILYKFTISLGYEILFKFLRQTTYFKTLMSHPYIVIVIKKLLYLSPLLIL